MAAVPRTTILRRPCNYQWYWRNSSKNADEQWEKYTDIENEIIEGAYKENKSGVEIDGGCIINLKDKVQYNKNDTKKQQPIKRVQFDQDHNDIHLRENNRFSLPVPITSMSSEQESEKNDEVPLPTPAFFPGLYYRCELRNTNKTLSDVVEDAAEGIRQEGRTLDKSNEAEWLAQQLLAVKHYGARLEKVDCDTEISREIGETCIYLYTKESFLYRLINQILRNPTGGTDQQIKTLGPFCFLLQTYLQQHPTTGILTVYRGLHITDKERKQFMRHFISFTSFTSTSRNRKKAESFGNTLLIIDLNVKQNLSANKNVFCGVNISELSDFPEEEEFLIWIYALFEFINYEYDPEKKKHIIHLKSSDKN
uniref:NAD(P)(+)--arginine ADP-ribosyltransferase n=1 Tax=Adineta vaga TaxID=104782 RepID=B3G4Q1_ADIVA|nr:NAD(P)(+)-arginine ADP-ribosyltransferase-like protein [Adineta vaga]